MGLEPNIVQGGHPCLPAGRVTVRLSLYALSN